MGRKAVQIVQLKKKFIEKYPELYTVTATCEGIGIGRQTFYDWLNDTDFAQEYEQTKEAVADNLEAKALERAMAGLSDTLIIFLLKGLRREKFGDRHEFKGEMKVYRTVEE